MKKLLAIMIMSVCVATVSFAQNSHRREMMRAHFERLDSATKSHWMNARKDFWEKQMKKNEKKWKKQIAARFKGGEEALALWIQENITYPMLADVNNIEGKVVVSFDVNYDGTVSNVQVDQTANSILASEVN